MIKFKCVVRKKNRYQKTNKIKRKKEKNKKKVKGYKDPSMANC